MHPIRIHKYWLDQFWSYFGGEKNDGLNYTYGKKLHYVQAISNVKIGYKKGKTRQQKRTSFDKTKYMKHSLAKEPLCFICTDKANVRHHLISLRNGGQNTGRNLISLCNPCHAKIHPWLRYR
jgi:5-methylcytosine-specific restriction endonuclease McrA